MTEDNLGNGHTLRKPALGQKRHHLPDPHPRSPVPVPCTKLYPQLHSQAGHKLETQSHIYSVKWRPNSCNSGPSSCIFKVLCFEVEVLCVGNTSCKSPENLAGFTIWSVLSGQQYCFRRENILQILPVTSRKVSQPDLGPNFFTKPFSQPPFCLIHSPVCSVMKSATK